MAGHLASQLGVLLLHFCLDQRMTRLIHDGITAKLPQLVVHDLRALHFAYKRGPWLTRENFPTEDKHQHVAVYNLSMLVDSANAVGIAVERDPKIRVVLANGVPQVLEVCRNGRIWMMIGEITIH